MSHPNKIAVSAIIESTILGMDGILLVEEAKHPQRWDLPGGSLKRRETIAQCGVREVFEESGLTVSPDFLVGIYQCPRTATGNNLTRFVIGCSIAPGHSADEAHPTTQGSSVGFYTFKMVEAFAVNGYLRNNGISRAIDDYTKGVRHSLDVITYLDKAPRAKKNK